MVDFQSLGMNSKLTKLITSEAAVISVGKVIYQVQNEISDQGAELENISKLIFRLLTAYEYQ